MKQIASIITVALLCASSVIAQENKDIQEKTTVKKVTMRNDDKVTTQVIEETDAELEIIEVEGNDDLDQESTVVTKNLDKKEKVMDSNVENTANKLIVAAKKQIAKEQMKASKQAEMERAAKEKMIMEQNKAKMMAELEARREALESRPKGMAKLKKKDNR